MREEAALSLESCPIEYVHCLLQQCADLRSAARALKVNKHWHGALDQESTWKILCEVAARSYLLEFNPRQSVAHGYEQRCRLLHKQRRTFAAVDDSAPLAPVEAEPFSIRVGVRFRPPASTNATDDTTKSETKGVCLPLHQKLQLIKSAHGCSLSEARRRLWSGKSGSAWDPFASAPIAEADKENSPTASDSGAAEEGQDAGGSPAAQSDEAGMPGADMLSAAGLVSLVASADGKVAMEGGQVNMCDRGGLRSFGFEHVWPMDAAQRQVFDEGVDGAVTDFINGRSCCVLAYGQTGSGKTHTMWGGIDAAADAAAVGPKPLGDDAGVAPRAVRAVAAALARRHAWLGVRAELRLAVVEVYGDAITDLLHEGAAVGAWQGVAARAVAKGHADVVVSSTLTPGGGGGASPTDGGAVEAAQAAQEVEAEAIALLRRAAAAKRVAATSMNDRSSRAHTLLLLTLVQQPPHTEGFGKAAPPAVRSQLVLADLGGSEQIKKSKASGERLQEAVNINLGLLALKNVIVALHQRRAYVPYQDDKLTTLLQTSLGGEGTTLVLVAARPEAAHASETMQALRFGETCSLVELKAAAADGARTAAAALQALDAEVEAVEAQIREKERWETRVVRRTDSRAGLAFAQVGAAPTAYLTDNPNEEYKVSGLFGAEVERMRLEQLLAIRRGLLGEA